MITLWMRRGFRKYRRPRIVITQLTLHPHDAAVIQWHGITEAEWHALDNPTRAEHRTTYMKVTMP